MTRTEEYYIELIEVLKSHENVPNHLQKFLRSQWGREIEEVINTNRPLNNKFRGKSENIELALE